MKSPIAPDMIDTSGGHWYGTFGRYETEVSAEFFVRACQKAGGWTVSKAQLDAEERHGDYRFNGLFEHGVRDNGDGTYTAEHEFIATCWRYRPAK